MSVLAFVIPSIEMGGAQRSLIKLVNGLHGGGDELHLISLTASDPALEAELEHRGEVRVHALGAGRSASPWTWLRLALLLRRLRPDVVVGWSTYANLVAVLAAPRCRLILSQRASLRRMFGRRAPGNPFRKWATRAAIRCLYRRAQVVTANSQRNLASLRRYIGPGPDYRWLPNVLEGDRIARLALEPPPPGLPAGEGPRLLALGRLDPQKGFDLLLTAFQAVRSQEPWHLVIAGDGPEGPALRGQAEALGIASQVTWLGRVANPFPLYRWADLVLVPSRFEGFPNVPLEAMALGRAVICADCETGPRELTEGGTVGRLVPVEDPAALAEAILLLGRDDGLRADLGRRARESVLARYERSVVAERYRDLILAGR